VSLAVVQIAVVQIDGKIAKRASCMATSKR
jgi:hypothetical protein